MRLNHSKIARQDALLGNFQGGESHFPPPPAGSALGGDGPARPGPHHRVASVGPRRPGAMGRHFFWGHHTCFFPSITISFITKTLDRIFPGALHMRLTSSLTQIRAKAVKLKCVFLRPWSRLGGGFRSCWKVQPLRGASPRTLFSPKHHRSPLVYTSLTKTRWVGGGGEKYIQSATLFADGDWISTPPPPSPSWIAKTHLGMGGVEIESP